MSMKALVQDFRSVITMHMRCLAPLVMQERIYYDKKREWNKIDRQSYGTEFLLG